MERTPTHPRRIAVAALGLLAIQASVVAAAVVDPASSSPTVAETASSPTDLEVLVATAPAAEFPADSPTFGRWAPTPDPAPPTTATTEVVAPAPGVFASVDGLALHLPGNEVVTIGYHEARQEHLPLSPVGQALGNWGLGPTPAPATGHDYVIMPSREREGGPTSAVDVVLPAGADVLSPVSGTVVSVAEYVLYEEHPDVQVQIVPDDRPDLLVTLYHLDEVQIRIGQRVEAGASVLAGTARVFDFVAQVEQWGRGPHVDLRVSRR